MSDINPFRGVGDGADPVVTTPDAPAAPVDPNAGFGYSYTVVDGKLYRIGIGNDPNAAPRVEAPAEPAPAAPATPAEVSFGSIAALPLRDAERLVLELDVAIFQKQALRAAAALRVLQLQP